MRIIRNYILRECVTPFFLALMVLTGVFLLGNLIQLAHLVINKGISVTTVAKVFILYIPVLLGYTLPIACLISVILGFSRLAGDNEILAIRASGIYLRRLLAPLLFIGIIFSLFSFILNDRIIPYAHHEQRKMLKTLGARNPTALLEPGVFINSFEKQILFIHKIEDNRLYNVTIYQPQPDGKPTRTIIAKRGEFTPVPGETQIILKLIDGATDEQDVKNPNSFYKLNFETFFMTLTIIKDPKKVDKKPRSMSLKELETEILRHEELLVDPSRYQTEFQRKITWSFSPLIFILLGFPLAIITNRREKTANLVIAIAFAAIYYLLSLGCEGLSIKNVAEPILLMWIPNAVGGLIAVILNFKVCTS